MGADLSLVALDDSERHMLTRLKAGSAIVDLAAEMGYSERSMYRALARLWDRLGVSGRKEGIHRVGEVGLLDCASESRSSSRNTGHTTACAIPGEAQY